ncbi:MAG: GtrA family protein [Tahibacter sp.]
MVGALILPEVVAFILASALAAIANFASRILFSMAMPYVPAIVCAFVVGVTTAFFLNRRYVFRDGAEPVAKQFVWFTIINLVGLAQTLLISLLLMSAVLPRLGWHWHAHELAHAVGIAAPIVTSYFGHKYISFRGRRTT